MGRTTVECRRASNSRYYKRSKAVQAAKRKDWRREFAAWAQSLKQGPCVDCTHEFPTVCMQWHHRDPSTKVAEVSTLVATGNRQKVLDEIAKCDLICANCHILRTWPQ